MKHLNRGTLNNIIDSMPLLRRENIGRRHPSTGLPVGGKNPSLFRRLGERFVAKALSRTARKAEAVVRLYPGGKKIKKKK